MPAIKAQQVVLLALYLVKSSVKFISVNICVFNDVSLLDDGLRHIFVDVIDDTGAREEAEQ